MEKIVFNSTIMLKIKRTVATMLILVFPLVTNANEYWTPLDGLCPAGYFYDDDLGMCTSPGGFEYEEMRFKPPVYFGPTITLKFFDGSVIFTGYEYDFYECCTTGIGELCKTNAVGVETLFGYKMFYIIPV